MLLVVASGCSVQKPMVTKVSENQYSIYVKGGLTASRAEIMAKWQETSKATCNGEYTVVQGPTSSTIEGVAMQIEGVIKCNK